MTVGLTILNIQSVTLKSVFLTAKWIASTVWRCYGGIISMILIEIMNPGKFENTQRYVVSLLILIITSSIFAWWAKQRQYILMKHIVGMFGIVMINTFPLVIVLLVSFFFWIG